jgi:hypothetical protein
MKKTFFISTLLLSLYSFGQVKSEKINGLKIAQTEIKAENDTIIKVVFTNNVENNKKPAYFINEKLVNECILKTINPNEILSFNVEKGEIEINNIKYYGKLKIETKSNYFPKLISLNNLKAKYIKVEESQTIFKINNEIINADYNEFVVDEKYILKLIVENYEKENLKISFINIVTKTEENIKKSKQIIIRGKDEIVINK